MTDKQKPTPETDAEISRTAKIGVISGMEQAWQDMAYHAKELERQRDEAREQLIRAQEAVKQASGYTLEEFEQMRREVKEGL